MSQGLKVIPAKFLSALRRNERWQHVEVADSGPKSDDDMTENKKLCTRILDKVLLNENTVFMSKSRQKDADRMHQCGTLTSRQSTSNRTPHPIPQFRLHIQDSASSSSPTFAGCPQWANLLLYSQHQAGYSEKLLCSIFLNLTDDLADSLHSALFAVMVLHKSFKLKAQERMNGIWRDIASQVNRASTPAHDKPWCYDLAIDNEELKVLDRSRLCVLRETHDPSTRRRTEFYANAAYCRQADMSPGELLAAVSGGALPEHMSQLDFVCGLAEGLDRFLDGAAVDVVRWAWPGRPAALMERRREQFFDSGGRNWRQLTSLREISSAEYDQRCAAAVAAAEAAADDGGRHPGCVSSLRWASGDQRSGAALLAAAAADRDSDETMAALASSPAGRERLMRLAGEIKRRFDSKGRAARRVLAECPGVEAWARARFPGMFTGPPDDSEPSAAGNGGDKM